MSVIRLRSRESIYILHYLVNYISLVAPERTLIQIHYTWPYHQFLPAASHPKKKVSHPLLISYSPQS